MPDFKPNDFQLGTIEFLSVLLPGAIITAALLIGVDGLARSLPHFDTVAVGWIAFGLSAYAAGHFIFLLSSQLDHYVYDPYRKLVWPTEADHSFRAATALRRAMFPPAGEQDDVPMNTFAWARASLMLRAPSAFADVLRYEADSKFFRSLVLALPAGAFLVGRQGSMGLELTGLALGAAAFLCYADRRHKSTEWAYRYIVVLNAIPPQPPAPAH